MSRTARTPEAPTVRERLLDTAAELFYREGVRAVGVDRVVALCGVAKTSLYRHFPTKDDLLVAVLERDDRQYWTNWDRVAAGAGADAAAELQAHVRWIVQYIGRPEFRGCAFLNAATEFPASEHPARAVALNHKAELRRRLLALARRLPAREPEALAEQLVLLIDGAYVNGLLRGRRGAVRALPDAALALIQAARISGAAP